MNRTASTPYLFSGILKCAECGSNLTLLLAVGKIEKLRTMGAPDICIGVSATTMSTRAAILSSKSFLQDFEADSSNRFQRTTYSAK